MYRYGRLVHVLVGQLGLSHALTPTNLVMFCCFVFPFPDKCAYSNQ